MTIPDTYLVVYEGNEGVFVEADEEGALDAAVTRYVESGRTRDDLLSLTMLTGPEYRVLASRVTSWYLSTPESRRRAIADQKARDDEEREIKQALGMWDEA